MITTCSQLKDMYLALSGFFTQHRSNFGDKRKKSNVTSKADNIVILTATFSLLSFVVAGMLMQRLAYSIELYKLVGFFGAAALIGGLTLIIAWITFSVGRACMKDQSAVVGGAVGLLFIAICVGYAPSQYFHDTNLTVSDLQYWESGLVMFITFLALSVMIKGRHYEIENTIRLIFGEEDSSEQLFASSPKDLIFQTPLYLKFVRRNNAKIIVLARSNQDDLFHIVDVNDDRTNITINDHNIRAWNLTSLERKIAGDINPVQDKAGYFSLSGTIRTLSTTALYNREKAAEKISLLAIVLAEEYLFTNEKLKSLLVSAIERSFNKNIAPMSEKIDSLIFDLGRLEALVATGEQGNLRHDDVVSTGSVSIYETIQAGAVANSIRDYDQRKESTNSYFKFLEEIGAKYNIVIDDINKWSSNFNDWWIEEILFDMRNHDIRSNNGASKIKKADPEDLLSEAESIIRVIGLRLDEVKVDMRGRAAEIAEKIKTVEQNITSLISASKEDKKVGLQTKDKEDHEMKVTLIDALGKNPTTRASDIVNLSKAVLELKSVPEQKSVPRIYKDEPT
jgi:hypothetical protein